MKKIISLFCAFALMLSLSSVAFAAEIDMDTEIGDLKPYSTYQEVLDMLNEEYGTNVHFPSAQECKEYGITVEEIDVSLDEFEAQMRKDIEASLRANAEATAAAQKLDKSQSLKNGSGVCKKSEVDVKSAYYVTRAKDVEGATVYLEATVNDNNGYWRYSSISDVYTYYLAGYNTTPAFGATSYNYDLIDALRTCAVSLYGYTVGNWGVILDDNAYRYVEFWAGSGM